MNFSYIFQNKKTTSHREFIFFNLIKIKVKRKRKNILNPSKIFAKKKNFKYKKQIDILIPVYNGYEYIDTLFTSIKNNTDVNYNLIVINDCSPDNRIDSILQKYKQEFDGKMHLYTNETNLGFVKTINKGLLLSKNDVVILNTDIVLPKNWANRLMYPIATNKKVASVTPFSNAATIYSLPKNNFDNIFDEDIEKVNNYISKINFPYAKLKFPTGVGFCMAMSKTAIKKVGILDEIFEKGYGEENDWCQRAISKGFINVVAPNLFVWHKHGGSFDSIEKQELIHNHMQIISARYPNYFAEVNKILKNKNYINLRFWAEIMYCASLAKSTQVWFDHTWGGGSESYFYNQVSKLKEDNLVIRMQNNHSELFKVSFYYKDIFNNTEFSSSSEIMKILSVFHPNKIVINQLATYNNIFDIFNIVEKYKKKNDVKIIFKAHDFQAICPTINLINYNDKYCDSNYKNCSNCFKKNKINNLIKCSSIKKWQNQWYAFLDKTVDEIIAFSNSSIDIFLKFYPKLKNKILLIPHIITPLRKVNVAKHAGINIGILGSISSKHKGIEVIKAIDNLLLKYPNIHFKIIGSTGTYKLKNISITGNYCVEDLPDILEKENIDLIFIPSIWPETFSYTTSEAMSMDIPVACFDIGAPAERIKTYNKGVVITNFNSEDIIDKLTEFCNEVKTIK